MIYTKIYKIKIQKETQKLYDLGGKNLVNLQEKYIKIISNMLSRWYKEVLEELENNVEVKYNNLYIDQKQFINKDISNKDFQEYSKMMREAFNIGAKQLNKSFSKDINIEETFSISPADAVSYANDFAGLRISGIDEYSKKRINALITQGIEKGRGYNKLAKEIQRDYSFSTYRSRFIASQEIGEAYLNGKEKQFEKYTREYGQTGWKQWVSHRDDRTTDGCLNNDNQGWIPRDQAFQSGNMKPTRFPGCRCNVVYRLFDPREDGEELTTENANVVDTEQSKVPEFTGFDEGIKPDNYDKYSNKILPASFFNAIGKKAEYIKPVGGAYYRRNGEQINLGETGKSKDIYISQNTEVHEVGHFFFTRVVLSDEEKFMKFKEIFKQSVDEVKLLTKNKELRSILDANNSTSSVAIKLFDKYEDISKNKLYNAKKETKEVKKNGVIYNEITLSTELRQDVMNFMDILGSLTKEATIGNGHGKSYYKKSKKIFSYRNAKIKESQTQEYFAHLNEIYFLGNNIVKKFLPKTYKEMQEFYKNIGFDDFI